MFNRYTASCVIVLADIYLVGQCGNQVGLSNVREMTFYDTRDVTRNLLQIGSRFWDLALREHASVNKVMN